jgi:acetoacetate decarboxylase
MKEHEEGYSMPLAAPTYTKPPFFATPESRILMMAYRADPAAVAFEVPEPLEPVEPNLMLAWLGDMGQPTHTMDLYHECLTAIKVRFKEWTGWYINYIWVDHDMGLIFEREIYGWPANLCDPDPLLFHGSQIIGHCNRASETLMRMSLNVTSPPPNRRPDSAIDDRFNELIGGDFLQLRKFPAPDENAKPIRQVLLIEPEDFQLHEIWQGNAHLEFGKSGLYPHLHKLAPVEILDSWYLKASWIVPYPKVVWTNQ